MAFKKIEIPDDDAPQKNYFKFVAVGDRLAGVYLSHVAESGQYKRPEYTFRVKGADGRPAEVSVNPPTRLAMALEKANLKKGHKVIMTLTGEKDTGKESKLKLFEVMVDDAIAAAAGAAAPKPAPVAAKPPPPPAGDEFDDIPF